MPASGTPAGSYVQGLDHVAAVDLAVLRRTHPEGWGTVRSTIPAVSSTIAGLLIGGLLLSPRPRRAKARHTRLTLLGLWIPVVMKLWTASYGIVATGRSCLLFLLFYWLIDVRGYRKAAFPLAVIGMNALAVYMGRSIVPLSRIIGIFTNDPGAQPGSFRPLAHAVTVLAVEWLILYRMYRRKIFLRA